VWVPFSVGLGCMLASLVLWYFTEEPEYSGSVARLKEQKALASQLPQSKTRVGLYDNVKLFAIIGVAIDHAAQFAPAELKNGSPSVQFVVKASNAVSGLHKWAVDPAMPAFFFVSGAVASEDLSRDIFLRSAVGLLLPAVLAAAFKQVFLDRSVFTWRVGYPFVDQVIYFGGFLWTSVSETDYWFLPTLFFLRVVLLPFFSKMRTPILVLFVFVGWLAFLLYSTGDSVSDGARNNTYIAKAFIYLPYYTVGYLGKRYNVYGRYIQFAGRNMVLSTVVKAVALGYLLGIFVTAVITGDSIAYLAGVGGDGCAAIKEPITTMLPWPAVDRFPNIGCIFGYQALLCINVLAIVFAMPYGSYRYVSLAGSRTLSGYLFMQVQYTLTALVLRGIAAWGGWKAGSELTLPDNLAAVMFLILPTAFVLFLCCDWFFYIASPIITPTWAMRVFMPDGIFSLLARWSPAMQYLLMLLGFGLLCNAVAASNGR